MQSESSGSRAFGGTGGGPALTRREFLRLGGAVCGAASLRALPKRAAASDTGTKGMLFDITRCTGCDSCTVACNDRRGHKPETAIPALTYHEALRGYADDIGDHKPETAIRALTPAQWTYIDNVRVPEYGRQYVIRQCMHCLDAACVSACPVAALHKTEAGAVVFADDRCIGCRYCIIACPFDIPRFEWDKPLSVIRKCDFCADRIASGDKPVCVAACPQQALIFGDRQALVAEAERRISANPSRYVNHLYGRDEVGGTSLLFLSRVPFAALGLRTDLGTQPLPARTESSMSNLPIIVVALTALFGGLSAFTRRRGRLQQTELDRAAPSKE